MTDVETTRYAQFGLVELDLLATYAGAGIPFPLQVPSFGEVPPARDLLFASAAETLQLRGLANEDGPLALAEELATLLAARSGAIDLVIGGPDWQSGAVALVESRRAMLCLQRFNAAERDVVEVYPVETDSLAAELVKLVPAWPAGHSIPVRLPLRAVRAAQAVLAEADPSPDDRDPGDREVGDREAAEERLRAALREGGADATATAKLVSVLHPLQSYGQLGVTRPGPDGQDVRVGPELSWLDTPRGRYSIASTQRSAGDGGAEEGWVSINPLHPEDLLGTARGFVSASRR
ncbi:MAG TPA: ESX secretion-associated protein EspG [Pseudonocardiaceae bacterium]|nr:ESX secretion-associated protein EspG [Pseudonocardiaceae bacterium]